MLKQEQQAKSKSRRGASIRSKATKFGTKSKTNTSKCKLDTFTGYQDGQRDSEETDDNKKIKRLTKARSMSTKNKSFGLKSKMTLSKNYTSMLDSTMMVAPSKDNEEQPVETGSGTKVKKKGKMDRRFSKTTKFDIKGVPEEKESTSRSGSLQSSQS